MSRPAARSGLRVHDEMPLWEVLRNIPAVLYAGFMPVGAVVTEGRGYCKVGVGDHFTSPASVVQLSQSAGPRSLLRSHGRQRILMASRISWGRQDVSLLSYGRPHELVFIAIIENDRVLARTPLLWPRAGLQCGLEDLDASSSHGNLQTNYSGTSHKR